MSRPSNTSKALAPRLTQGTSMPPPTAGSSKQHLPPEPPYCNACFLQYGCKEKLQDDNFLLACPRCGLVDENATYTRNTVSVSETRGAQMDENESLGTFERDWEQFETYLEKSFKDTIDALLHVYLLDHRTSVLGYPAPSMVKGAKMWYLKIREAEKDAYHRVNLAQNGGARRITYQIGVAIKFAIQESSLIVVNNRLGKARAVSSGFTKGDDRVRLSSLAEIFDRANRLGPGAIGYMDSLPYFTKMYRKYSLHLGHAVSALDNCLILLMQCVKRLRELAEIPHSERLTQLITTPKQSGRTRKWLDEDFAWFRRIKWDDVLLIGYNLYKAQQCVDLWGKKCSPSVAIALTMWSCMAIARDPIPQYVNVCHELAASLGQTHFGAVERAAEMKNFLICWSTSISDAGVPFPKMKLPQRGTLGDGLTGYASDRRRRIPEVDMAATAARTIADNWRKIMLARLRTRSVSLDLDEEHNMARKLFAAAGPRPPEKFINNPSFATIDQRRVPLSPGVSMSYYNSRAGRSQSDSASPVVYPVRIPIATPPPERNIEDMLAMRDDSSDDGDMDSDEESHGSRPAGLGLKGLARSSEPFSFSVGLDGFSVDRLNPISATGSAPRQAMIAANPHFSSDVSRSPSLMARQRSTDSDMQSDTGPGSASEAEHAVPVFVEAHYPKSIKRASVRASSSRESTTDASSARSQSRATSVGSTSRSLTSGSASPMSAVQSIPASPTLSERSLRELSEMGETEGDHIGQLKREREQYMTFRQGMERAHGRLVSAEVESAMKKWVGSKKMDGTIPASITPSYLEKMGLFGDPYTMDLGPWIESLRDAMSPVEALLRIGIRPTEFPPHYIIHSLVHLDQQLELYHADDAFAPMGETIDDRQLDTELRILFGSGEETLDHIFLSPSDQENRRRQYQAAGIVWEEDDDDKPVHAGRSPTQKGEDELGQIAAAFDVGEDEEENEEDRDADQSPSGRLRDSVVESYRWRPELWDPDEMSEDEESGDHRDELMEGNAIKKSTKRAPRRKKVDEGDGDQTEQGGKKRKVEEIGPEKTVNGKAKKATKQTASGAAGFAA